MTQSKAAGSSRGGGAIPLLADRLPAAVHRMVAPVAGQGASLLFDLMVTSIAYVGLLADREGLPDVQRLAEAIQPAAAALDL